MTTYTDEMMRERLAQAASFTLVMLRVTDTHGREGTQQIVWEHGRGFPGSALPAA